MMHEPLRIFFGPGIGAYKFPAKKHGDWEPLPERAIDASPSQTHDGHTMQETAFATNRRSQRIFHRMKLQALGRNHAGKKFREVCETLVVNAHGGLLILRHEVDNDEMLLLVNPETQEEQECRIRFTGDTDSNGILSA